MNILVISKDDYHSRWVTFSLASVGHRVAAMTSGAHRLTRLSRHCRAHTPVDAGMLERQENSLVDRIADHCRHHGIQCIVPADLPATLLLAKGREALKGLRIFPVSDPDLIRRLHNKWEFYQMVTGLGLPTPKTWRLENREQTEQAPLAFPLMVKPIARDGGAGVQRIESRAALMGMLDGYARKYGWPILAQEHVPGKDIDISVLADQGRIVAWTIQINHGGRLSLIEFCDHPRILEVATTLIQSCRYHGVMHFDMRIDERTNSPVFIEANPRFWASLRHSVWSGVNFAALGVRVACGEDVSGRFTPVKGPCRDPGFSIRPFVRALLHGRPRPENWSGPTETGWRCHLDDPLPEVAILFRKLSRTFRKMPADMIRI
jgi:predicted ATP-grasp superfamily ATP-dependent carboligase